MRPISYRRAESIEAAIGAGARPETAFLAGGTSLVDLMKLEVLQPAHVVDITRLGLKDIELSTAGLRLQANATNAAVAAHAGVRAHYPAISEALLAGASPQLRNVATVAGNLLQRTRCAYYRDLATACNKRTPGAGCSAREGWTRMHAILGTSEHCIAAHPSDLCVALAALDATVRVQGPEGARDLPFAQLHLLPGDTPDREFALAPGELITSVFVPASRAAARSRYLKVRDRQEYAFALTSCAAGLDVADGRIRQARLALGGVGTKPWRCLDSERWLAGKPADAQHFNHAAELALQGARTRPDNAFKIELAKRTLVRALRLSAEST
jgi:xanthine dehydrogenase YagS FAD-binding subunit